MPARNTPAYREWQKAYDQRPDVKERKRKYMETYVPPPDVVERNLAHKATPEYKARHVHYIRRYRAKKYGFTEGVCPYCGGMCSTLIPRGEPNHGQVDHITPLSRGGKDTKENRQLTCAKCNIAKANMTHEEYLEHLKKQFGFLFPT